MEETNGGKAGKMKKTRLIALESKPIDLFPIVVAASKLSIKLPKIVINKVRISIILSSKIVG